MIVITIIQMFYKTITWSASTNTIFFTFSGKRTSKNKILYLDKIEKLLS